MTMFDKIKDFTKEAVNKLINREKHLIANPISDNSNSRTSNSSNHSPATGGGLSLRNEFVMHQIDELEEKKKVLSNELVSLHVQVINTKKEYALYHKSLLKLKKTIEFISQSEEHLAKEKTEINEIRTLLEQQRRHALATISSLPARQKELEEREAHVAEREKELFAQEALLAGREFALIDKEKFVGDQSIRSSQLQATTQANVAQIKAQEARAKELIDKANERERAMNALEIDLAKKTHSQNKREEELNSLATHLDSLKVKLMAQKEAADLEKRQLTQYTTQLQQQTVLVQQKALELAKKEAQMMVNSAAAMPYQASVTQVNTLQTARNHLVKEVEHLQTQVGTLRSEYMQTQASLATARSELSAIARQRLSFSEDFAQEQEIHASRERLLLKKQHHRSKHK